MPLGYLVPGQFCQFRLLMGSRGETKFVFNCWLKLGFCWNNVIVIFKIWKKAHICLGPPLPQRMFCTLVKMMRNTLSMIFVVLLCLINKSFKNRYPVVWWGDRPTQLHLLPVFHGLYSLLSVFTIVCIHYRLYSHCLYSTLVFFRHRCLGQPWLCLYLLFWDLFLCSLRSPVVRLSLGFVSVASERSSLTSSKAADCVTGGFQLDLTWKGCGYCRLQ